MIAHQPALEGIGHIPKPRDGVFSVYSAEEIIEDAFRHYRNTGFPYHRLTVHECKQQINRLAAMPSNKLAGTDVAHHVADMFQPWRFHVPVVRRKTPRTTPIEAFGDDALLRKALRVTIEQTGAITEGHFRGSLCTITNTQAAANFRPGFALLMYRRFCPAGGTILDTSMGFGGRMVGFFASEAGHYIGIDPATPIFKGNVSLAESLGQSHRVSLIHSAAEDINRAWFRNQCNFAFTSPPYFSKERYTDEPTQSWKRYEDGDSWRTGFLEPMMRLQFSSLKPGAISAVNVADVTIAYIDRPLREWTIDAGKAAGFLYEGQEEFPLGRAPTSGVKRAAFEPVLLFRKPHGRS